MTCHYLQRVGTGRPTRPPNPASLPPTLWRATHEQCGPGHTPCRQTPPVTPCENGASSSDAGRHTPPSRKAERSRAAHTTAQPARLPPPTFWEATHEQSDPQGHTLRPTQPVTPVKTGASSSDPGRHSPVPKSRTLTSGLHDRPTLPGSPQRFGEPPMNRATRKATRPATRHHRSPLRKRGIFQRPWSALFPVPKSRTLTDTHTTAQPCQAPPNASASHP